VFGSALLIFGPRLWAGAAILGLAWFWPLGLGLLALFAWSGRMGCWGFAGAHHGHHRHGGRHRHDIAERWRDAMRSMRSTGNVAFDEYRADALRRLEEDHQEFKSFLDRLRHAKDKEEFDQFMAERVRRPENPTPEAPEERS
jgi:hypothetical protein